MKILRVFPLVVIAAYSVVGCTDKSSETQAPVAATTANPYSAPAAPDSPKVNTNIPQSAKDALKNAVPMPAGN